MTRNLSLVRGGADAGAVTEVRRMSGDGDGKQRVRRATIKGAPWYPTLTEGAVAHFRKSGPSPYTSEVSEFIASAELGYLLMSGEIAVWPARELAERWHWSKSSVDRFIQRYKALTSKKDCGPSVGQKRDKVGYKRDTSGADVGHDPSEKREVAPSKRDTSGTRAGHEWDKMGQEWDTSRARDQISSVQDTGTGTSTETVTPEVASAIQALSALSFAPKDGEGRLSVPDVVGWLKAQADAFPGVDLAGEIRKAQAWAKNDREREKPKKARGLKQFFHTWFKRAHEDLPTLPLATTRQGASPAVPLGDIHPLRVIGGHVQHTWDIPLSTCAQRGCKRCQAFENRDAPRGKPVPYPEAGFEPGEHAKACGALHRPAKD